MAADWCDIDYSAFAYDRAYEEDLCIDDFSHDFLLQAQEPVSDARCVFPASEAARPQALFSPPGSAEDQYASFFAQGREVVDARVVGDVIDPTEAPLHGRHAQLWRGAKRDDGHDNCALSGRQQLVRKRALQRARKRAFKDGGTWYKNRWVTCRDIGEPGEPHVLASRAHLHMLRGCEPKMPVLPSWPPTPTTAGSRGPRMPRHGLGVLSFNLGGFSNAGFDEFQRWLHLETTKQAVHVVFLQETWRGSTEFRTKDWLWIQSGRSPVVGQGVAVLLNTRFADSACVRYAERRVGRVLMVMVPALRGHPLRRRPTTLICAYQHARISEQAEVYDRRAKIWALLHQVVAAVPRRHLLLLAGDLNTPLRYNGHLVGRGVLSPSVVPSDEDQFAQLLEAHSLVALNTFGRCAKSAATFIGSQVQTQLDFVLTRTSQAGPLGRRASPQPQLAFFQWREGNHHLPVYAVILDTCPEFSQAAPRQPNAPTVDRHHMAHEAQHYPHKVLLYRQCVQEALDASTAPLSPERLDDIVQQASMTIFAGKPAEITPYAWQSPTTALRLQEVWAQRRIVLATARQVRVAWLCFPAHRLGCLWRYWVRFVQFNRARKALRRNSQQQRRARWVQQLEDAEQALARHDSHTFYAVMQRLAPKQARGRVQLKGPGGEILTAEAEIDKLHEYWNAVFHDGSQAPTSIMHEGITVTSQEVHAAIARLPMRKASLPGRAHGVAWRLAAVEVAPHLHQYVQQAWIPGPVHIPLYLTEAWLHFMSKPGRTLRTPGDLRPLALQSAGGKALSKILKSKLVPYAERVALHVPQFAYLRNRDTHSAIARALAHFDQVRSITHGGQRLSLHARKAGALPRRCAGGATLSLDLSRAFDSVGHLVLWEALLWAEVPHDLAVLLLSWYHSEYAMGQRDGGYIRRISITKGVKQGCVIAPTIWVIMTCYVHHRLDERLSAAWSEAHATCFADDFLFQWMLDTMKACKAMCSDIIVIYDVFSSLDLCINSKKSALLLKLVGTEADTWLTKHRLLAPADTEAKHVFRYDMHRRCDIPIKSTHVYLGIVLTYGMYEEETMKHRLRLAAVHKHRLSRILQGRGGLARPQRLRLWRVAIATSMMYALHVVGLTQASLRLLHVMMVRHLRAIMRSPRHLTQEADLDFLVRISQDTPLQMLLKAVGSTLERLQRPTDFPCYAAAHVVHRLHSLRCDMLTLSEAPAPRGTKVMEVPTAAPVFECQFCGQVFATLHMVKSHEGKVHKHTAPTQQLPNVSYFSSGGLPQCRFCGETFARWWHLKRHVQNNRCAGLRRQVTAVAASATAAGHPTGIAPDSAAAESQPAETAAASATLSARRDASAITGDHPVSAGPNGVDVGGVPTARCADPVSSAPAPPPSNSPQQHSVWQAAQHTDAQNRDLPVAEWPAVCAAGTLEKIVQVPGVRKLLVQTCCLCGQWVAATNGLRQHLRTIHKDVWVQHESTILHMAKLWSKSAISPCSLCAAVVTEPRQHPKRCTVFAQACLLELLNRPATATGHDGRAGGRCTGPDALRAPPHPSGDGRNGQAAGSSANGRGCSQSQKTTAGEATAAQRAGTGQSGTRGTPPGQQGGGLLSFFRAGAGARAGSHRAQSGGSASPSRMRHGILPSTGDRPGPRHDHPNHVQCGRTLAETAGRQPGAAHLFFGRHDVQVSPSGDEQPPLPCPEDEGGPRGAHEAGHADGQAGLAVHDLGQGQRQTGPGHHPQPLVNQGAASDATGGGQPAAEHAGDANTFQLYPAPRTGDHQCHGSLPYRCHAQGQSTLSDSAQVVATQCVAPAQRASQAGTGQAQSGRASGDGDAQSFVLSLRLRNDVNQCYANSLTLALTWTVLLHGGRTASPLQALFLRLRQTRKGQLITLRKLQEWQMFANGWPRPLQQHDVSELFTHMCTCVRGLPDCCQWTVQRAAGAGIPSERGGDGPILLQIRHTRGTPHESLQDCFEAWHEQMHLYAIASARPMLVVQLSRFIGHGVFCTKDTADVSLGSGVVQVPCFSSAEVMRVPYRVAAAIIHIGSTPLAGHYRSVLFDPVSEGAGVLAGAYITDDGKVAVPLSSDDHFGKRVYLVFLTRVES